MTTPGFEQDIKPLFRPGDREAMLHRFDLWSHDDVAGNIERILSTVRSGSMPCDDRWPDERVELLQRWADGGMPD